MRWPPSALHLVNVTFFFITNKLESLKKIVSQGNENFKPCRVGVVVSVSTSHTVGREFASRPGDTKDHHKNGTNCLLHGTQCIRVGVWQCSPTV